LSANFTFLAISALIIGFELTCMKNPFQMIRKTTYKNVLLAGNLVIQYEMDEVPLIHSKHFPATVPEHLQFQTILQQTGGEKLT
jgi:hypothetical protein